MLTPLTPRLHVWIDTGGIRFRSGTAPLFEDRLLEHGIGFATGSLSIVIC